MKSGAVLRSPEEPPGLDRVRRFLARPLAAVRFVWLWARWIGIHLGRGLAVVGRSAYRGARVAQAAGAVAASVGKMGNRLDGMGQNWSRAGGRLGRVGGRLASAGRRMRSGGSRWADTARGAAGVGVALGELHEAITGEAPEGEKPIVWEPVAASVPEVLPEPATAARPEPEGRTSPTPPGSAPAAAPATTSRRPGRGGRGGRAIRGDPAEREAAGDSGPVPKRSRRRSREVTREQPGPSPARRPRPADPHRGASEPERPSGARSDSEPADPPAGAASAAGPADPDPDARAGSPPAAGTTRSGEPGDEPPATGSDSAPPPTSDPSPPIAAASTADRKTPPAAPLAGDPSPQPATSLPGQPPEALREAIRNLGERPRRADLRALITRLCAERWATGRDLAAWLGVHPRNLRRRHLDPMAAAGLLERRERTEGQKIRREYRAPANAPE